MECIAFKLQLNGFKPTKDVFLLSAANENGPVSYRDDGEKCLYA